MKKVIFHSGFTFHQKFILVVLSIVLLYKTLIIYTVLFVSIFDKPTLTGVQYIYLLSFPLTLFVVGLLFSKKGISIDNGNLYQARFLLGQQITRKKVSLDHITDVSILKFNGHQKYAFVSKGNPDLSHDIFLNEIYLLNEKHTTKLFLISSENEVLVEQTVALIQKEFNLNFNKYSPDFS